MNKKLRIGFALISIWALIGCGSSNSNESRVKGELLLDISAKEMKDKLTAADWPIEGYTVYGYKAYKIAYTTKDENDVSVKVSGLLTLPTGLNDKIKEDGPALVSYGHGTIALNDSSPTVFTEKNKKPTISAIIFSSLGGFATLQADYIGYGNSVDHYHSYVMKKSLANSSIDFITAVKKFAEDNNIKINNKLFVTGYSEGGYAAMSTLKALEENNVSVVAAAPMAGAYDLKYMANSALGLNNEVLKGYSMLYTILTLNAYSKSYDKNISEFVKEPYASKIDELLDGKHSFEQIDNVLPHNTSGDNGLLYTNFVDDYQTNSDNWFKIALQENSVNNWKPNTPLSLVHCEGDDKVPYTISQNTYHEMLENGAENVTLITPDHKQAKDDKWGHGECFLPAIKSVALWFIEMRDK